MIRPLNGMGVRIDNISARRRDFQAWICIHLTHDQIDTSSTGNLPQLISSTAENIEVGRRRNDQFLLPVAIEVRQRKSSWS